MFTFFSPELRSQDRQEEERALGGFQPAVHSRANEGGSRDCQVPEDLGQMLARGYPMDASQA